VVNIVRKNKNSKPLHSRNKMTRTLIEIVLMMFCINQGLVEEVERERRKEGMLRKRAAGKSTDLI
jgi:hypothetical protein